MGRLLPNSSSTVPSDPEHHEETPPGNQPPPPPPPPPPTVAAATTEITVAEPNRPNSPSPPQQPQKVLIHQTSTTASTSSHHDELQHSTDSPALTQPPPQRHDKPDDVELMHAVSFPPHAAQTNNTAALPDNNQIVPYMPPEQNNQQHEAINYNCLPYQNPLPPGGAPGVINGQPPPVRNQLVEVYKPPVPVHANGAAREQQPPPQVILVPFVGVPWKSGLFDCCQHPRNAIITAILPCVTFGQIAEILDNGSTSCLTGAMLYFFLFLVICHWNVGVNYRRRMRKAFELAETPVTDRIAHVMFPLCALCQEFRELKYRGYDPFLGYQGVIAGIIHDQGQEMVYPQNQAMLR